MSTHRDEFLELCAGYVLGGLEPQERAVLEAHLAQGCPECEAELSRLSGGVLALATSVPPRHAPAALRSRILDAVRAEPGAAPERPTAPAPIPLPRARRTAARSWGWAIAAALVLALVGVTWKVVNSLERELSATRSQLTAARRELDEEKSWMAVLESPRARVVELQATPDGSPALTARVIFDPATRRAVVLGDSLTAPVGKDYQLWAITAAGPASLGLVRADAAGRAVMKIPDVGDPGSLGAFAVSLEREGGAPTPHAPAGPVVLLGKLAGS
jgi:anti-sigma-K factor RskA